MQFSIIAQMRATLLHWQMVLIADVIGSSARKDLRGLLEKKLAAATRAHREARWIRLPYTVTAGDEFQTVLTKGANIGELIFDLRMRMRPLRLRIGIGFGKARAPVQRPVNRMVGEAFQRARKAIESVKKESTKFEALTRFRSGNETFDSTANLIYALQDTLLSRVTPRQWETIQAFRSKKSIGRAARALRLNRSTVSRNLRRGFYWQIEQTISGLDGLIRGPKGLLHENVQFKKNARKRAMARRR